MTLLPPFDSNDDVSILVQEYYNPTSEPGLRTTIKILDNGRVLIQAPGIIEPILAEAGQEIVIDLSLRSAASASVQYAMYRITKRK